MTQKRYRKKIVNERQVYYRIQNIRDSLMDNNDGLNLQESIAIINGTVPIAELNNDMPSPVVESSINNVSNIGTSATSMAAQYPTTTASTSHFPATTDVSNIGTSTPSTAAQYPSTTASTSHFPSAPTDVNYIGTSASSTAAQYPSTTASTSHFPATTDVNFIGTSATSMAAQCPSTTTASTSYFPPTDVNFGEDSHTTNIVGPVHSQPVARRNGTTHSISNPVAPISQNEGFVSCREFQIIIQGIARLTVLSQDISNQLNVISTRLSKLEEERGTMETSDDITMPKFPLETLQEFDLLEAKLKDEAFKKAFERKIKRLGGKDLKDVVFTAIHYVMSVELRAKFNWCGNPRAGSETKRGLEKTNTKNSIFDVIEKHHSFTDTCEVIKFTKNAVRHAPQTVKGKAD